MAINGLVLYEGPSVLDGVPIVVIATLNSMNRKTGNVIQTWILLKDVAPNEAVKTGRDSSICGKCPHRHFTGGGCYVLPFQAPLNVFKEYHLGKYPKMAPKYISKFINRDIRLGSYGDPAAVPYVVWLGLVSLANSHTGFTHQMENPCFDSNLLKLCQVSVDTPSQYAKYAKHGTFRVKTRHAPLLEGEILCRNTTENLMCSQCGLCDGSSRNHIAIEAHGRGATKFERKFSNA